MTYEYQGKTITKVHSKKWTIDGDNETRFFVSLATAKAQIDADLRAPAPPVPTPVEMEEKQAKRRKGKGKDVTVVEEQVAPLTAVVEDKRYAVLMATGTPALGAGTYAETVAFLAQRLAQSAIGKPLRQFKVQELTLKPNAEHNQDYLHQPIAAELWAKDHVSRDAVEQAAAALADQVSNTERRTKALKSLSPAPAKTKKTPTKTKTPKVGERYADEQIVADAGGKITYGMVRRIRSETAVFFTSAAPRGKVAAYRRLAQELDLGLETVAKVARRNILEDVE